MSFPPRPGPRDGAAYRRGAPPTDVDLAASPASNAPGDASSAANAISHTTPSGGKRTLASPPLAAKARPSKRVPKPLLSGSETEGPPDSLQIRRTKPGRSGSGNQRMATLPCGPDNAPYFTALVASS